MIYSPHTFEIALDCNSDKFQRLLNKAYKNSSSNIRSSISQVNQVDAYDAYDAYDVHIDSAFANKGIEIEYHDTIYKKKIKLIVNPTILLGGDDAMKLWKPNGDNVSRLLRKLEKCIDGYFGSMYKLDDFKLAYIDFAVNIDVGCRKKVSAYIKVLRNIGKVKGFSPKYHGHSKYDKNDGWYDSYDKYDSYNEDDYRYARYVRYGENSYKHGENGTRFDKKGSGLGSNSGFALEGNSNGIEFAIYDKEAASKRKDAKGVLYAEVRLTKQKAIREHAGEYIDETDTASSVKRASHQITTSLQIAALALNSKEIFLTTFVHIVPYGDYYKKKDTVRIIAESDLKRKSKAKMLRLLELIPKKKSLLLAQKSMNERDIEKIMSMFYKLNISPVTISKRHDLSYLDTLYVYLFDR